MLTASPTRNAWNAVCADGVRDQRDLEARVVDLVHGEADAIHADRALVGDVAQQRHRRLEAPALRVHRPSADAATMPTPSTWPLTRCPPRRSVGSIARSRFTGAPTAKPPSVVSARVSLDASTANARIEFDHGQADR
jgi:hypothetical protein